MKAAVKKLVTGAARRSPMLRRLAWSVVRETATPHDLWAASRSAYVAANRHREWSQLIMTAHARAVYETHKQLFLENALKSRFGRDVREALLDRFEQVDANVESGTTRTDGILLAEALLSLSCGGDLVECGCYAGASTCKLSVIAKVLGRKLYVFDSFEGLPTVDEYNLTDYHARRSQDWVTDWAAGRYAADIDLVRSNVAKYGDIDVCVFCKGWFSQVMFNVHLPAEIAFAFVDADIPSSVRECVRAIWPRLVEGGVFFSHDVAYIKVLQELHDQEMWTSLLREYPPIIFGAGFGHGEYSPHLGFMVKDASATAAYIKSLTLEK